MTDARKNYQWTGIDRQGGRTKGVVQAIDPKEAQLELKKLGIEVITLNLKKDIQSSLSFLTTKPRIKPSDILFFTKYLSSMLSAGLSIIQSLDIISRDQENSTMKAMVIAIKTNISGGKTLAESFSMYPKQFNEFYCNLIKAGEKSGTLDTVLKRLGNYLERTENLKKKVKKALIYPTAIISVAIIVTLVLLIFVVPRFQKMFESLGAQLPWFTRMVVDVSNFLQSFWWVMIGIVVIGVGVFKYFHKRSEKLRENVDSMLLRLIIIGPILRKGLIARYTRTLSTMLDSGMPIVEAMKSITLIMDNANYRKAVMHICDDIASGQSLSVSMSNTTLFPNMVIQMVAVGEAAGSLSDMLSKIAEHYEEEVNNTVDNLSSLLEPLIMVILGVIIGTFVVAMYLPIFKMGSLFK